MDIPNKPTNITEEMRQAHRQTGRQTDREADERTVKELYK